MRWVGHVARMGDMRGAYRVLVWDRKERKLVRHRRRKDDNIKIGPQEVSWGGRGLDCCDSE